MVSFFRFSDDSYDPFRTEEELFGGPDSSQETLRFGEAPEKDDVTTKSKDAVSEEKEEQQDEREKRQKREGTEKKEKKEKTEKKEKKAKKKKHEITPDTKWKQQRQSELTPESKPKLRRMNAVVKEKC